MRERFPLFRFFQRLLDRKTRKNLQITIIFCTFVGKQRNMEGLVMIYATITVVAGAMALWLHTKWGKKFLENL